MKKLIAILLTFTVVFTLGIPAFASDAETETPQITEEILDVIQSDEFKENLEDNGIDAEEFEENIGNGDYIIVEDEEDLKHIFTDEEIEEIRKQEALSVFSVVKENAFTGLVGLAMLPFVPVMLIIPVFGWVTSSVAIASPFVLITIPFQFIEACIESVDAYVNFDDGIYRE